MNEVHPVKGRRIARYKRHVELACAHILETDELAVGIVLEHAMKVDQMSELVVTTDRLLLVDLPVKRSWVPWSFPARMSTPVLPARLRGQAPRDVMEGLQIPVKASEQNEGPIGEPIMIGDYRFQPRLGVWFYLPGD